MSPQLVRLLSCLALCLAVAIPWSTAAAASAPRQAIGGEFFVDPDSQYMQHGTSVARDGYGNFVVAWRVVDYSIPSELYVRLYDEAGRPRGSKLRLDTPDGWAPYTPLVAMNGSGAFVAVWTATSPDGLYRVLARRYDRLGQAQGEAFVVNQHNQLVDANAVAMDAAGGFLVSWTEYAAGDYNGGAVRTRRYDAGGSPLGASVWISDSWPNAQQGSSLHMNAAGEAVIAWTGYNGKDGYDVLARPLDRQGQPTRPAITVTEARTSSSAHASVAMDSRGNFVVTWHRESAGTGYDIWYRLYDKQGSPRRREEIVNQQRDLNQVDPVIAMDLDGDFVIAWGDQYYGYTRAYLRWFDAAGEPRDAELWRASQLQSAQIRVSVAMDADGDVAAFWMDDMERRGSGNLRLRGQLYAGPEKVDLAVVVKSAPAFVQPGQPFTLELQASNQHARLSSNSIGAATGVELIVDVAPELQFVKAAGQKWQCDPMWGQRLRCRSGIRLLPTAISETLRVTLQAPTEISQIFIGVQATGDHHDPITDNDWQLLVQGVGNPDVDPDDSFAFPVLEDAPIGATVDSQAIRIKGINMDAPISVSGGRYSINYGGYQEEPGTIPPGAILQVSHFTSLQPDSETRTTVTIGGRSAVFRSVTEIPPDPNPDPFSFPELTNTVRGTWIESAVVQLSGTDVDAPIGINGGMYRINGGPWSYGQGSIPPGATLQLRHYSSDQFLTRSQTTVVVGGRFVSFVSTTEPPDTTPDAYNFVDLSWVVLRDMVSSNVVTLTGFNASTQISLGGDEAYYSVNGNGLYRQPSLVKPGDKVQLHVRAAQLGFIARNVTVTIGGVTDKWQVRTGPFGPELYEELGWPKPEGKPGK